ncbi:MAG: M23 family peptidase [Calditrichaeota bacterium]|nr:MAG: M23 family peptidase [Calditrichota bacterium]
MSDIFEYRKRAHETYLTKYVKIELNWRKIVFYILALSIFLGCVLTLPIIYFSYFHANNTLGTIPKLSVGSSAVTEKITKMEKQYSLFSEKDGGNENSFLEVDDDTHDAEFVAYAETDDVSVHKMETATDLTNYSDNLNPDVEHVQNPEARSETSGLSKLIRDVEFNVEKSLKEQNALENRYNGGGVSLENIPTIRPMLGGRISDIFGQRLDPFLKKNRHHSGLDFAAPIGTQVYAPAAGKVIYVRRKYVKNRGYGKCVKIDHGGRTITLYGHLSKIHVEVGQEVKRWDVIGLVGDTGRSTGPHLHYEVSKNGKRIDPMRSFLY